MTALAKRAMLPPQASMTKFYMKFSREHQIVPATESEAPSRS
jgi:hypothetical protein